MLQNAPSDLVLNCLPLFHKNNARLLWVKSKIIGPNQGSILLNEAVSGRSLAQYKLDLNRLLSKVVTELITGVILLE